MASDEAKVVQTRVHPATRWIEHAVPAALAARGIGTLIELIALIFLICPSLRFGRHGEHVSIAQPKSGCQDQSDHCDQSDQCFHTFGTNSGLA